MLFHGNGKRCMHILWKEYETKHEKEKENQSKIQKESNNNNKMTIIIIIIITKAQIQDYLVGVQISDGNSIWSEKKKSDGRSII